MVVYVNATYSHHKWCPNISILLCYRSQAISPLGKISLIFWDNVDSDSFHFYDIYITPITPLISDVIIQHHLEIIQIQSYSIQPGQLLKSNICINENQYMSKTVNCDHTHPCMQTIKNSTLELHNVAFDYNHYY